MIEQLKYQLLNTYYAYIPLLFKITLQPPARFSPELYPVRRK
jgi:hypothetical protein